MQNEYYSRTISILLISVLEILERFSYYGMRSIIVLYAVSENGLQLENTEALSYYGTTITLTAILLLPAGLISDFITKQRNGTLIGGIIALIGYLSLQGNSFLAVSIAVILVLIGTSLTKVNLTVLLGRCYKKTDSSRDVGFVVYYFAINVGALLGSLFVAYFGAEYGWNYGFGLCAIAMLVFIVLLYSVQNKLNIVEGNERIESELSSNSLVLDAHLMENETIVNNSDRAIGSSIILIAFLVFINGFYWQAYELAGGEIFNLTAEMTEIKLFGFEIYKSVVSGVPSYLTFIFLPLFAVIWYNQKKSSSWQKMAIALIMAGVSMLLLSIFIPFVSQDYLYILFPMILFSAGEVFIGPIAMSYVTRLSPLRFSSTFYGLYSMSAVLFGRLLGNFFEHYMVLTIVVLVLGITILIFRKQLVKLAGGLD